MREETCIHLHIRGDQKWLYCHSQEERTWRSHNPEGARKIRGLTGGGGQDSTLAPPPREPEKEDLRKGEDREARSACLYAKLLQWSPTLQPHAL